MTDKERLHGLGRDVKMASREARMALMRRQNGWGEETLTGAIRDVVAWLEAANEKYSDGERLT